MISGIIKVEASVISRGRIIPDITKTEFNYCFIIHCFMKNIQKLLCEMQVDFTCACKIQGQTHQAAAVLETISVLALFSQRYIMHAHSG